MRNVSQGRVAWRSARLLPERVKQKDDGAYGIVGKRLVIHAPTVGKQIMQRGSQCVDIGARIRLLRPVMLRGREQHRSHGGCVACLFGLEGTGDSKVHQMELTGSS